MPLAVFRTEKELTDAFFFDIVIVVSAIFYRYVSGYSAAG